MTPSAPEAAGSWRRSAGDRVLVEPFDGDLAIAARDDPAPYEKAGSVLPDPGAAENGWQTVEEDPWSDAGPDEAEGLSGRGATVLGSTAVGLCAALNLAFTAGRLTFFFDLCFVVICLVLTMSVRRQSLFTAGVLPPLLYAGVMAVLAVVAPHALASGSGISRVFLTGLADHAAGLVAGYAVALIVVAARVMASNQHPTQDR